MMETSNRKKIFIFGVFIATLFLVTALRYYYVKTATLNSDPVGAWFNNFIDKSYSSCDSLVEFKSDKLLAERSETYGTLEQSQDMYFALLEMCSDSITDVKIKMSGKDEATVSVKVKPYKKISKVTVDEKKLDEVKSKYLNGEMSDADLYTEIGNLYLSSFKSSVGGSFKDEISTTVKVSVEKGLLRNTHEAVLDLLESTNLLDNLKLFEDESNSTVTVLLHK